MKKVPARIVRRKCAEAPRDAIMRILKLRGESTVAELCRAMEVTGTAVRRQLAVLKEEGLVGERVHQKGPGRPTYKYRLTEKCVDEFPHGYENMAGHLLDTVYEQSGHTGVMNILRLNNEHLYRTLLPRFEGKDLESRVEEIALYYSENGYMSGWTKLKDGNFFLYHQNCAIYKLAVRYRQLCIVEPRLIESLLGVKISRQQYILKNQPICGYLVDAKRPLNSI